MSLYLSGVLASLLNDNYLAVKIEEGMSGSVHWVLCNPKGLQNIGALSREINSLHITDISS